MNRAHVIGTRTLLAMTCVICGKLKPGEAFERYKRNDKDRFQYLTKRCRPCRWKDLEAHR